MSGDDNAYRPPAAREPEIITSPQNPLVKNVVKLSDRRQRDRQERLAIEGYRAVSRALDNRFVLEELFFCPELYLGTNEPDLVARVGAAGARLTQVSRPVFEKIAYRDRPEGLLAVAPQFRRPLQDQLPDGKSFFVVAESIEKPGNLGTMLRSCDAAGVDALILSDPRTDIFNPNVVRASIGTLFTVPVWQADTPTCIQWCRDHGVHVLAATPHTDLLHTDVDMTGPIAVVMGTEQVGLTDAWMDAADLQVKIPMYGQVDSLNVAAATTILLYEVVRQRRAAGLMA